MKTEDDLQSMCPRVDEASSNWKSWSDENSRSCNLVEVPSHTSMNVTCEASRISLLEPPHSALSPCSVSSELLPAPLLALAVLYAIVFTVGLAANTALIAALVTTSRSSQLRSRIVFSQCVSDMMVTLLSVPDTLAARLSPRWYLGSAWCRVGPGANVVAIGASTLSLMMISVERCIAVRHTRMLNQTRRGKLGTQMTIMVWTVSIVAAAPLPFVYSVQNRSEDHVTAGGTCIEQWRWPLVGRIYYTTLLLVIIVVPCTVVVACHARVSRNLRTANSIVATAVINDGARGRLTPTGAASDSEMRHRLVVTTAPATPASTSRWRLACRRLLRRLLAPAAMVPPVTRPCPPPLLRSTSSYSLRTRQQLAATLTALALTFVGCWLPYTTLVWFHLAWSPLADTEETTPGNLVLALPYALLLGHAHSALNPIVYALVHRASFSQQQQQLKQRRLDPGTANRNNFWRRIGTETRRQPSTVKKSRRRLQKGCKAAGYDHSPSSTNVGNLGAFHPRYMSARRVAGPVRILEPSRTSHFFN